MSLIGRFIDQILPVGSITLVQPDGSRQTYGPGGGKHVTVRFHDKRVGLELFRNPRLRMGELYMNGRITVENGTILDLLELIVGAKPWEQGKRKALGKGKSKWLKRFFRRNDPRKSRHNVAHHYDIGNQLYELFLDRDLQYSCAYFTDITNTLEQAQEDKKAHIAAKLFLKPGQKVLDIGCGWGGMALYLNRVADVEVLGITLSEEQLKVARRRAKEAGVSDRVRFELIDYRHLDGRFDRIVSVGMFEHVGAAHYEEFYAKCRELLTDDGVMLLHTIGKLGGAGQPDPFTDKWIFPGYHLPSLSQMCSATEKVKMIVGDVETLRLHYAYTLREWLRRFTDAREKVLKLYDERFFRMWEFYLAGGIVMFESGAACNYQVQYIRDRNAVPITRDYMAEAEARYREFGPQPAKKAAVRKTRAAKAAEPAK
ncbi:cyclopropane-fatty-acyl-phospholipid synthase family protein [Sphingomonas sp. SM33]|uniref:Cyclopropane-fatty-acyl-phospholipid synthase family protein n=1 Tax=Sphingomonas telluris TaxID=2907998 RepID=A0ABS9VQA0_9SPHN|nr:cyclopropane-fatty-acyl-phospholipid synthase family protein [Sphingomonas telluris]MCH8616878.1 cyclopropane-fatty-acyl-phospholipid synthase family protein [Sphingomonas telluris]